MPQPPNALSLSGFGPLAALANRLADRRAEVRSSDELGGGTCTLTEFETFRAVLFAVVSDNDCIQFFCECEHWLDERRVR